jgi:hypothetical protein
MALLLNRRVWVLAERLYIHCNSPKDFQDYLKGFDIEYPGIPYADWNVTKVEYTFMSDENATFAEFMQRVPTYKYLKVLQPIVFDDCVQDTANDNWNYYGEQIKKWYPALLDLLHLAGITIDPSTRTFRYDEGEQPASTADFLSTAFNDPFLDHVRKEINEGFDAHRYLTTMILSRKLLECTVLRLFEVVFPKIKNSQYSETNHSLWFDKRRGRFHGFDVLLDNLRDNAAAFDEDRDLVRDFVSLAKPFKDETNSYVHADYKIPDENALRSWKIPYVCDMVRRLFRKYCNP